MANLTKFLHSLYTAFQGLTYVVRVEQNARIHLILALLALALGVILRISDAELAAVFFAIILVFTSEVVNTALEKTLDLIEPKQNDQVRIIKDIAAGAVLVTAVGAAAIGVAIFLPHILELTWAR